MIFFLLINIFALKFYFDFNNFQKKLKFYKLKILIYEN